MKGDGSAGGGRTPEDEPTSGDDLVAQFARWSAGERASRAASSRSQERSLREQAASSATWAGALVDLAEAGAGVSMTVGGTRFTGRIEAVGVDFCVLLGPGRRPVIARLDRVSAVRPEHPAGTRAPAGSRLPSLRLSLAAAMSLLAEERAPVTLATTGGHQVTGELVGMGENVLTVREREGPGGISLVSLENLEYCLLR